uniref:uncharacterized protein LOC122585358 isoform X2 n=1 Tax=Erigeron canadensis TaxID=72917 RepID=UPI001CB991C6|nr:uncharacterized protein LOC122585358 isoform X2 [Erigeron canadensis]
MIGSKVILTYKRKRLSSGPGFQIDDECPDQSPKCQSLEVSNIPVKEEEDTSLNSERRDHEILKCDEYRGDINIVQCEHCHISDNVRVQPSYDEHPEGNKICSNCAKQLPKVSTLEAVGNSCEGTMEVNKPGFPLITFSRRSRNKKTMNGNAMQDRSIVPEKLDLVAEKGSNFAMDDCCILDLPKDLTANDPNPSYCGTSQEKNTSEDGDLCDVHSPYESTIKMEKPTGEALMTNRDILKDTPSVIEPATEAAITDVAILKDKEAEASECHVSAVDESQIISGDDLESAKIVADKQQDGGSPVSFDLSKPPPESSDLMNCTVKLESSSNVQPDQNVSEMHRDSADSTSRSHSIVMHESPRGRVLDLLDDKIGEASQVHTVPARLSSSSHIWGSELPSMSMGQSQIAEKNYLQLFPEDRVNETFPLRTPLQETSFMHPNNRLPELTSSNWMNLHFRSSKSSTPSSSLFPWPNFDTKTREQFQDMTSSNYPSDPISLMRHKMMLDNIISKARAMNGNKGSFVETFDSPNPWSEEELDFLWIGVRRHGKGNWDAILRDPRLHFTSWRSPRELAEQWAAEQSKLFNPGPYLHTRGFRPTKKCKPNPVDEMQFSLGSRERSTFDPLLVNRPVENNLSTKGNLPHWLQELTSIPPRPVEQGTIPSVSYTGRSGLMQWINQPFSGTNKSMGAMNIIAPEVQSSSATRLPDPLRQPVVTQPINKLDEVIVIDSDASSEETVSDDRSVKS